MFATIKIALTPKQCPSLACSGEQWSSSGLIAYGTSKLWLTMFARELACRVPDLDVFAVHPGECSIFNTQALCLPLYASIGTGCDVCCSNAALA